MLNQFGQSEIPGAIQSGWTLPTDEQMPAGVAELAKVVGEHEAARASWQRRLCVLPDGSFRLLINECSFLSHGSLPQFSPGSITPVLVAVEIGTAAALLKQPSNCETVLAQRQRFVADLNRRHQEQEESEANQRRLTSARQQAAAESAKAYRWDDWRALTDWQRLAYSLALAIDEGEDPAPALRRIAGSVQSFFGERAVPLPPPAKKWW